MWPRIARRLILPLHEKVLGRSTFQIWSELEAYPRPDSQQLATVRAERLHRLLAHAQANIPYWSNRLAGRLHPIVDDPAAILVDVPVLTRAEIQRNREAMRWTAAPGKLLVHRSGGTTDDNLTFFWSRSRQSWDRAMRYRGLARHGIYPGDRILHLWPCYPRSAALDRLKQGLRGLRDWLTNDVVIDLRPFSAQRLDAVWRYCTAYRPVLLIAYPSWLVSLGEHLRTRTSRPHLPDLRSILCTGEALFSFQRRFIEETFGVPVIQEYGSQDAGLIAHEDPAGLLRLNAEQMLVEVLHNGMPVPPGELGEVVVTHFFTEVMPFIRYATGDVVRAPAPAATTTGLPIFPLPEGRTSDQLVTVDGSLCSMRQVVEALAEQAGYRDFSLHQTESDRIVFLELASGAPNRRGRGRAEEMLRSLLGQQLRVEWRSGSRFVPLDSGKRRFVCSPAALRLLAHDRESGLDRARGWPQRLVESV